MWGIRRTAAIALVALVACDGGASDPVDAGADASDAGGGAAGRGMDGGAAIAGRMAEEPRDAGQGPSDSGDRDADSEPPGQDATFPPMDAGDARVADDGGPDSGVDSGSDSGSDGGVGDGQVDDAAPPLDAGDDDGGPEVPGLCAGGTAGCAMVQFTVFADLTAYTGSGEIEVEHGETTLELDVVAGESPEVLLPAGEPLWVRTRAAGYWDDRVPLVIPSGAATLDAATFVFSSTALALYHAPFGLTLDETKGFVVVDFFANHPGAGVTLGAASDPSIVASSTALVQSPTLVPNPNGNLMLFSGVQPGALDPMPVAPAGKSCSLSVGGVEYTAEPKTVLRFWVACQDAPP